MRLIPAILCGGAGSRLWPVSREAHPKPFIRLADGQSLLQKAFLRGALLPQAEAVLTVTNRELFFKIADEFREVNARGLPTSFILEPFGRNTAAAVACAALQVERTFGPEAAILALPADHLIVDTAAFGLAVDEALGLAAQGNLVTFGIRPESPETGYGYIEAEGNRVLRFAEKPTLEHARAFVASGRFLWNSGMFLFTAGTVLAQMAEHCPEVLGAARECLARSTSSVVNGAPQLALEAKSFAGVPDISIDYALMERSHAIRVVPCDIGWSDIGSWNAIAALCAPDERGNRIEGRALVQDASNCYVRGEGRLVGLLGVENLVVVDTPDALLVADKSRVQDVRQVYARLKAAGDDAHRLHSTVHRPWGTYTVLNEGPRFKLKRIEVNPGAFLSLQLHHQRSEHWVVVSGQATVVNGEREFTIEANESTFIPVGCRHRLGNATAEPLVIIEVQCGDYLGEDDIVRLDDHYGRPAREAGAEPAALVKP